MYFSCIISINYGLSSLEMNLSNLIIDAFCLKLSVYSEWAIKDT